MKNVIDISLSLDGEYIHQTPEGVRNVQLNFEVIKDYPGGDGQQVRAVHMRLHHGTHVDAPMHFVEGGASIDKVPLSTFCGEAVVVDLTYIGEDEPILPEHLERGLAGRDICGQRVLLRTDWNRNYGRPDYWQRSPYIGRDAVHWLIERGPVLVGYDYGHVKDAPDTPRAVYAVSTFLSNGIVTLGYLRNLDKIDPELAAFLVAVPLAFEGVEASPVRAVIIQ